MYKIFSFLFIGTFLMLTLWSCSENSNQDSEQVSEQDIEDAGILMEDAYVDMENIISDLNDSSPTDLKAEMTLVYSKIEEALELDPDNYDANFSIALMGLMLVIANESFDEMLNQWEEYFDDNTPFEYNPPNSSIIGRGDFGLPVNSKGMQIPISPFLYTPLRIMTLPADYIPQFSELQNIVRNDIMPYVDKGISGLAKVEENQSFIFLVSSKMQPDVDSDPLELDLTEVYTIDMMLNVIKALGNTLIGHNFDFITHDADGILTELNLGSQFGALNNEGATDLASAHSAMQTAIIKLDSAISFLENETDDQNDDMIAQMENEEDYVELRDNLAEVKSAITQPRWLYYSKNEGDEYYYNYNESEDSILVDIQQFFLNPFQDLKQLIPPYSVTVDNIINWDWLEQVDSYHNFEYDTLTFYCTEMGNNSIYYFEYYVEIDPLGNIDTSMYSSNVNIPEEVIIAVDRKADSLAMVYENHIIEAYLYWNCFYSNECSGSQKEIIRWNVFNAEYDSGFEVPVITWNADNFNEWKNGWPDPTFNGILPQWTTDELLDFLGINDEDDWKKVIDW